MLLEVAATYQYRSLPFFLIPGLSDRPHVRNITSMPYAPKSIEMSTTSDGIVLTYPLSMRIESVVLFTLTALLVCLLHCLILRRIPGMLSGDWYLLPACLAADCLLLRMLLANGACRSPAYLKADGTVRQGLLFWKFPGPPIAESQIPRVRASHYLANRYMIGLRWSSDQIRIPGGVTEASTIGMVAQLNKWASVSGRSEMNTTANAYAKRPVNWPLRLCVAMVAAWIVWGALSGVGDVMLMSNAPLGQIAIYATSVFAALAVVTIVFREYLLWLAGARGYTLYVECLFAILAALACGVMVTNYAQGLQFFAEPVTRSSQVQPVNIIQTHASKGCQNELDVTESLLGVTVTPCIDDQLAYWKSAKAVRVHESRNMFGVRIDSFERADGP